MKTIHWVLIFVGIAIVGVGVYFLFIRKKKAPTVVPKPAPAAAQSTGSSILSFAENLGKKEFGNLLNDL